MKEKFSIFSSPTNRSEPIETSINFKKSPNKFVVYEPIAKSKELTKPYPFHTVSSHNLQTLRKLPNEYSSLRQTLNFKTSDFDGQIHEDIKDKVHKPTNILRQTLTMKPAFKPRYEAKNVQSYSSHEVQSSHQIYPKNESANTLGYSRKSNNYIGEGKSWHNLYDPRTEDKIFKGQPARTEERKQKVRGQEKQRWRCQQKQKYKNQDSYKKIEHSRHENILEQLQQLKKISNNQEITKSSPHIQRKFSASTVTHIRDKDSDQYLFRKKVKDPQQPSECYTPKLPKYSYDERFKKVGSPTSTDNSDSRSPPNKFVDVPDVKKKPIKIGMQQFVIGKTLGEGKFGVVMVAKHKKTGSLFALKKIPKAMIRSHMMVDQLTLQIKLQSYLNHKNVLGMYGFFDDKDFLYIVLQYMEQGTLYSQLKKNKILSEVETAGIIKQITEAVEYLHDQDIAHRDIKPENIVISNNVCKLCDFGWATLCNQRRNTYCGTFDYAAPQILQGKEYDMSVDLWCLGVLTYELMTGKAPFYHLSRKETMKKIINVETQSITYPQTMTSDAIDFIEKLVRKNPMERMKAGQALKHPFLRRGQNL